MRRAPLVALVLVAVVALPACGTDAPSPDDRVRAAVHTFAERCAADRPGQAAELLTAPSRKPFVEADDTLTACSRVLGSETPGAATSLEELRDTEIVRIEETGGIAYAYVELPGGGPYEVEAELVTGTWRLVLR